MALSNQNSAATAAAYPLLRVFTPYSSLMHYKGYFVGACPICNGKPARMVVRPDQGAWHCYDCGAGGDAIDFLQGVEQLSRDQAYLLYKVLLRDESRSVKQAAGARPSAAPAVISEPLDPPPEIAATEAVMPTAEVGTLAGLRERLGAVEGFRGVAFFGTSGKALLMEGIKPDELVPINAYFDNAFRAVQGLLGPSGDQPMEGVLQDDAIKFMRLDAAVAGSPCRVFLALSAAASEARFRMAVHNFLSNAKAAPQ